MDPPAPRRLSRRLSTNDPLEHSRAGDGHDVALCDESMDKVIR